MSPKLTSSSLLGSLVPNCLDDVLQIIVMASHALGRLREIMWTPKGVSKKLDIRIYKALILPIGSDIWTMRPKSDQFPTGFRNEVFKAILRVTRSDRLRNIAIRTFVSVVNKQYHNNNNYR